MVKGVGNSKIKTNYTSSGYVAMGALEAYKNSDIFSTILLAIITIVIPGSKPLCIIEMTEATLRRFTSLTGGLHSLTPGTSQKTTSNKQEKR